MCASGKQKEDSKITKYSKDLSANKLDKWNIS